MTEKIQATIVFESPTGDRFLLAKGSDWHALIGDNGTKEITSGELLKLEKTVRVARIRISQEEWDAHERARKQKRPAANRAAKSNGIGINTF